MAHGKKTGGRDWAKGQSGNPAGSKTIYPPEVKAAMKLTRNLFQDALNKLLEMGPRELKAYVTSDPNCTSLEAMIAGQIAAGISGKSQPVNLLLDRSIGPVKQVIQVDSGLGRQIQDMTPEEKVALVEDMRELLND